MKDGGGGGDITAWVAGITSRRLPLGKLPSFDKLGPCVGVGGGVGGA